MSKTKSVIVAALKDEFNKLPLETTRDYETTIVDIAVANASDPSFEELIENEFLEADIANVTDDQAFAAFGVLVNLHRRNKNFKKESSLIEKYRARFESQHPMFDHYRLLSMLDDLNQSVSEDIIELARNNIKKIPENCGVKHAFSDVVATFCERQEFENNPDKTLLKEAQKHVERAIGLDPEYAKFYSTYARILSLQEMHDEALLNIRIAIDKENSKKEDYAIRISSYLAYEQLIIVRARINAMCIVVDETKKEQADLSKRADEIRQMQAKNMEFIGLFAGIVSFTIGSINIAASVAESGIQAAAALIVVLMGSLLVVFGGFGIILHGFKKKSNIKSETHSSEDNEQVKKMIAWRSIEWRNVVVMTIGLLIVVAAWLMAGGFLCK